VFSSAFRAFTTPVCKSARTLVVPPGVRLYRLLGEGRGPRCPAELGDRSGESDLGRVCGRVEGLVRLPSSVRALALPVLTRELFIAKSNGVRRGFLPTDEMGIPSERMAVIETENAEANKHREKAKTGRGKETY
jgi:hypothetical protein